MTVDSTPPEIVTLAYCPGCEQFSLPGDCANVTDAPSSQLWCPRCGTRINAEHVHGYADIRVVEYE
jgi:hypothetical protein